MSDTQADRDQRREEWRKARVKLELYGFDGTNVLGLLLIEIIVVFLLTTFDATNGWGLPLLATIVLVLVTFRKAR